MQIETTETGSYGVNCSLIENQGKTWIVDPGSEPEKILRMIGKHGRAPDAILLTHAHFDHVSAVAALEKEYPGIPVYVHPADLPMFAHPMNACPPEYPSPPKPLTVANALDLPMTIHTPGHTPGSVCYLFPDANVLFSGDTLFAGSVGRTDFPGGSMSALMSSLKHLAALPPGLSVIPGHGPFTTIGDEIRTNPYM